MKGNVLWKDKMEKEESNEDGIFQFDTIKMQLRNYY
jgi:hypothetical protein